MQQGIRPNISQRKPAEKPETHLVIDGNSLLKRCISIDKRVSQKGWEWGGIFQFLMQVKAVLRKYNFDYVYAFFDGDQSGYLRYKLYHAYKANRDKHYDTFSENQSAHDKAFNAYCKRTLDYHAQKAALTERASAEDDADENFRRQRGILGMIMEELFIHSAMFDMVEGDDLIAYYVKNKKPQDRVVIMSGDMDLAQLISDTVIMYCLNSDEHKPKFFINSTNSIEKLGFTHKNAALIKTICGDKSDNIFGITGFGGIGHKTLFKFFPELITEEHDYAYIEQRARELHAKKPSKFLENLINHRTTGEYDGDVIDINNKLVSLEEPMLTEEAKQYFVDTMYKPIDPEGRDLKNIKQLTYEYRFTDWLNDETFGRFFSDFTKTMDLEKKRYKMSLN
jgi:5'-3' exonuclease